MPIRFRQDIQGLRALAVVLVALDHARVGPFHGGYIGVDVFFVISGFLITSLLVTEAAGTGTVSLFGFYARRARRILPAATVVMLATIVASLALLSAVESRDAIEDALWATFFAANLKFARDGTDYFNAGAAPSPLQHYWSLAVEEQFYVVWPVLVLLVCLAARLIRSRRGRSPSAASLAVPLLVAIVAASLTWSILETRTNTVEAYFSPFTRAWELALGALAACVASRVARAPQALLGALSWLGLGAIVFAALTYSSATLFPGYAAVVPVLGTVLLLLGGLNPDPWGPQWLLGVRPVRTIGDWSYSFYLWHWPALIMAGAVWGTPSGWSGGSVLLVALALAGLTYRYVENPVRRAQLITLRHRRGLVLYPAVVLVTVPLLLGANRIVEAQVSGGGAAITTSSYGQDPGTPTASAEPLDADPVAALVEASVLAARNGVEIPAGLQPSILDMVDDKPDVAPCAYFYINSDRPLCPRGNEDGDRTLVLVGDSHARQWIPALEVLAERYGYTAYYLVREGCPAADVTPWLSNDTGPSSDCSDFQDWAAAQVAELEPDVVVMASDANAVVEDTDGSSTDDDGRIAQLFEQGMVDEVARVAPYAGRVIVLGDPPALKFSPALCLSGQDASLAACMGEGDSRSIDMIKAIKRGTLAAGAEYVPTSSWFCYGPQCPTVIGTYIARLDRAHITATYSRYLADELEKSLLLDPDVHAASTPPAAPAPG